MSVTTVRKILTWFHEAGAMAGGLEGISDQMVKNFKLPDDSRWRLRDLWSTIEIASLKKRLTRTGTVPDFLSERRESDLFRGAHEQVVMAKLTVNAGLRDLPRPRPA
jgi:hypothetical protein